MTTIYLPQLESTKQLTCNVIRNSHPGWSLRRDPYELEQIVEWYNQKFDLLFIRFQFNMSLRLILSQFGYTILLFDFDCLYSIFELEIDRSRILQGILFPDWPFPPILRMLHWFFDFDTLSINLYKSTKFRCRARVKFLCNII